MVWQYRSPIPVGRRGTISLPAVATCRGRGGVGTQWWKGDMGGATFPLTQKQIMQRRLCIGLLVPPSSYLVSQIIYLGSGLNTGVGRSAAGNLGTGGATHTANCLFAALAVRNFRNFRTFCPGASRSSSSVPSSLPFHLEQMLKVPAMWGWATVLRIRDILVQIQVLPIRTLGSVPLGFRKFGLDPGSGKNLSQIRKQRVKIA